MSTRRVDFLVHNKISVEIKAVLSLDDGNLAQAINYLEAYNLKVGLLINFGYKKNFSFIASPIKNTIPVL